MTAAVAATKSILKTANAYAPTATPATKPKAVKFNLSENRYGGRGKTEFQRTPARRSHTRRSLPHLNSNSSDDESDASGNPNMFNLNTFLNPTGIIVSHPTNSNSNPVVSPRSLRFIHLRTKKQKNKQLRQQKWLAMLSPDVSTAKKLHKARIQRTTRNPKQGVPDTSTLNLPKLSPNTKTNVITKLNLMAKKSSPLFSRGLMALQKCKQKKDKQNRSTENGSLNNSFDILTMTLNECKDMEIGETPHTENTHIFDTEIKQESADHPTKIAGVKTSNTKHEVQSDEDSDMDISFDKALGSYHNSVLTNGRKSFTLFDSNSNSNLNVMRDSRSIGVATRDFETATITCDIGTQTNLDFPSQCPTIPRINTTTPQPQIITTTFGSKFQRILDIDSTFQFDNHAKQCQCNKNNINQDARNGFRFSKTLQTKRKYDCLTSMNDDENMNANNCSKRRKINR